MRNFSINFPHTFLYLLGGAIWKKNPIILSILFEFFNFIHPLWIMLPSVLLLLGAELRHWVFCSSYISKRKEFNNGRRRPRHKKIEKYINRHRGWKKRRRRRRRCERVFTRAEKVGWKEGRKAGRWILFCTVHLICKSRGYYYRNGIGDMAIQGTPPPLYFLSLVLTLWLIIRGGIRDERAEQKVVTSLPLLQLLYAYESLVWVVHSSFSLFFYISNISLTYTPCRLILHMHTQHLKYVI